MLEIIREPSSEKSTLGKMLLGGQVLCDTLEDPDRSGSDMILQPDEKIYGKTCIPFGGPYEVVMLYWAKYGCKMPHIKGVPLFTELFIHPGSLPENTLGCPLVGVRGPIPDFVGNSRVTFFEKVLPRIHDWLDDQKLYLYIKRGIPQ